MRSERAIVFLVGAVQFVNIVDFMMVMPLGPDFAVALGVPLEHVGIVGGAYTLAAAVAGLALSPVLDRFDRRVALGACLGGLAVGTVAGGFATSMTTLVLARVVAGAFGGPATSLSLSIVADVVPVERRGRAMGAVMGAFAVASVLGVPAGLELARLASWRAPFFATGGAGLLITGMAVAALPRLTGHLDGPRRGARAEMATLAREPASWTGLATTALLTFSGFLLIPNLSAFLQFNLGWPREQLGLLYMLGGALSFVALRVFGALVDKLGVVALAAAGALGFVVTGVGWFLAVPPPVPVWVLFPAMMLVMSARNVSHTTQVSRVPLPAARAAFQSLNSAVQHLAAAAAALLAASLLSSEPSGRLLGIERVAVLSLSLALLVPLLAARSEVLLARRAVASRAEQP